jgi:hypothetical protein
MRNMRNIKYILWSSVFLGLCSPIRAQGGPGSAAACCASLWSDSVSMLESYPTDPGYSCGLLPVLYAATQPASGSFVCPDRSGLQCGTCVQHSVQYIVSGQAQGICYSYVPWGVYDAQWDDQPCTGNPAGTPCRQASVWDWAIVLGFPVPGSRHDFGQITCSSCFS